MDLNYSQRQQKLKAEIRDFLENHLPSSIRQKEYRGEKLTKEEYELWHSILQSKGWLAASWPKDYGGPGWGPVEQFMFEDECGMAFAPRPISFSLKMLGPVLIRFGTEKQKEYYLPRILSGEDWWCQGYSEPNAGSDLASLKTKAVRQEDHFLVNGQKTWTSFAQYANKIFCLVRTSSTGKPQQGISFLLIDMDTPGVEVRPIRMIDGGHDVNEVFFTDVKVPQENLIGEENQGWEIAKYLLTHERVSIAGVGLASQTFKKLKSLSKEINRNGKPLLEDDEFAVQLADIYVDLEALKISNMRMLVEAAEHGSPGPVSSILKIKGTLIQQRIDDLLYRALGARAGIQPADNRSTEYQDHHRNTLKAFNNYKISIYGGSNEIQKNILSKMVLGL